MEESNGQHKPLDIPEDRDKLVERACEGEDGCIAAGGQPLGGWDIESLKALKEALRRHNEEMKPNEIDRWSDDGGQQ